MKLQGRKAVVGIILFFFLISLAGPVGASPFNDMDKHWATKDVSRMYAKGVVAGYGEEYRPNESISREQAIVMLIRVLGLTGESQGVSLPINFRNPDNVSKDFRPMVGLAANKGIITSNDIFDFRPKDQAKRYEIAVYIARAMGFDPSADGSGNLPFTDTKELTEQASGAVPYVHYIYRQGIMSGDADGSFRPMDHVTRAEMAALLSRVDAKIQKLTTNVIKGEVRSISPSDSSILMEDGRGQVLTLGMGAKGVIFRGDQEIALGELRKGDKIEAIRNSLGQGTYIEVIPPEKFVFDQIRVAGTIATIQTTLEPIIEIRTPAGLTTYNLTEETKITVDNLPAEVKDLMEGQEANLLVEGKKVITLESRNVEREIAGQLYRVNFGLRPNVVIEDEEGTRTTYYFGTRARIDLDGYSGELEDLVAGQEVRALVDDQEITRLWATSFSDTVQGSLIRADFAPTETIILSVETAKGKWTELTFEMDKDARIKRNRRTVTLRDLVPGDQIELELRNNKVSRLDAQIVDMDTEGRITSITLAYSPSLTLMDNRGQEWEFVIAPDARLRKERARIAITDLRVDDYVSIRVEGQSIVDLWAEERIVNDYTIGTIGEINERAGVIVLDDLDDGSRNSLGIYVDDSRILKFGDDIRFRDLEVGDRVIVTGTAESYRFLAETILVIGATK